MTEQKLTDYIDSLINAYRNGSVQSRSSVDEAIAQIYGSLDLKPPRIVWCENPTEFAFLPLMYFVAGHVPTPFSYEAWKNSLGLKISKFRKQVANPELKSKLQAVLAEDPGCMGRPLNSELTGFLMKKLQPALAEQAEEYARNHVLSQQDLQFQRSLSPFFIGLRNLCNASQRPPTAARQHAFYPILAQRLNNGVRCAEPQDYGIAEAWGVWDYYFLAHYHWHRRANNYSHPQESVNSALEHWMTLVRGGLQYIFLEKCCFVHAAPSSVITDASLRPHSTDQPAISFGGGQKFYCINGIIVPPFVVRFKKFICPFVIDKIENAELKRVMLDVYGWERYFKESKVILVAEDSCGRLYRKEMNVGEHLCVVEVINSTPEPDGSLKKYLLRVPPDMVTAKQAVAWTFGLRASEYDPDAQT